MADHLVRQPLGDTHCRVYVRCGAPSLPQTVQRIHRLERDGPWAAFERDSRSRAYDQWMLKQLANAQVRLRVGLFNAAAVLHTGLAVGVLPTFMALRHPDLRRTVRLRAFMQPVGDAVAAQLVPATASSAA